MHKISAPLEFRQWLRRFTLDDAKAGINPLRLPVGPMVNGQAPMDLFVGPVLQYRYKEKVFLNGAQTLEWSPWIDVSIAKEGDELDVDAAAG